MTTHDDPARRAETAASLSLAMLVLLERLSPEQRAVLLREVLRDDRHVAQAGQAGTITIEGDRQAVARLLGLFPQPAPAALAIKA